MKKRYLAKDEEGNVIETPEQLLERVSRAIAKAEDTSRASLDIGKKSSMRKWRN